MEARRSANTGKGLLHDLERADRLRCLSLQGSRSGILIAAFFGVFASFASVFIFTFSVFLKPLAEEFHWSRTQLSGGFALAAMTVAFASPFIGRLVDRYGAKAIILPCATLFAAAFASMGWMTASTAQFYGTLFLMGLVGNGTTQLAFSRPVVQAFDKNRGLALATVLAGTGVGAIVMPLLAQRGIDTLGWRTTMQWFGLGIFLLIVPLSAWLLPAGSHATQASARKGMPAALRSGLFWMFIASFFLMSLAVNAALAHLAALLTDRGFSAQSAAFAASLLGGATLGGRLLTGWLLDRWRASGVCAILFGCGALGVLALLFANSEPLAWLSALLIGAGLGAEADVIPYLLSRYFDMASFSELYGFSFTAFAIAGAIGPLAMGRAYDVLGSYDPLLGGLALSAGLSALLMVRIPAPKNLATN